MVTLNVFGSLFVKGFSAPLAYLDPGTGSYVIQLLIAGLMGAAFLVKLYWGKIKSFFVKIFSKDKSTLPEAEDDAKQ